ncbi:urea carboxylase [Halieaceae bacterium IMCC14734]|uniref:Urea carboxylase n=1 Tax=Candidatus Litorirhabdus singularis TaxID=2518993 RepID=A0ABT3TEC6_9GAMM|nr:urea carboxylase [Candidatus Litorirhabdus singularis]MCX2980666.1 urea carboxylase [Candidatus Litorirhabdus singularis]
MFSRVLIANRGAIATRIIRTLQEMGVESVAVYNEADAESLHVQRADTAVSLGEGSAAETYLNMDKILEAALVEGAQAIHPGYGFLSENTEFVSRCEAAGIAFIGPTAEQMNLFGLKHLARVAAEQAAVPLVPGSPLLSDIDDALNWAADVGYPVMLKSTAGGGGIGMQVCDNKESLTSAWGSVKRLGANYFANDDVFLEKYIGNARHIEVQVFGDGTGSVVSLGERDCSAQRRNQKVIEESPAPNLDQLTREKLHITAERLMASVNYRNAGTVEFIFDADQQQFYFLEVNTRLQVEHGVTELVWGVDLVSWMLQLAAGDLPDLTSLKSALTPSGHAIQVRVYAEDPAKDFQPCAGLLSSVKWPEARGLRIDHWVESGVEVPSLFDPMLAKVIAYGTDRLQALAKLSAALAESELYGIETNLDYLQALLAEPVCQHGKLLTRSLLDFNYQPRLVQVIQGGTQTTIQDYPGRCGLWNVGVPPSGPMDSLSFRLANRLLKNSQQAAALEITLNGPTLLFTSATQLVICGAEIEASVDGQAVAMNSVLSIDAGQTLKLGKVLAGARSYLAIAGGIQCPQYLGSRSTFTLGQFGGHAGRVLRAGDVLRLDETESSKRITLPSRMVPAISDHWTLRVMYGPHGAPDFFKNSDIDTLFKHEWEVHYNSSRTGVRLIGPKPDWARETGGEAGLHPSNIHDNAYAFGTVDFTGDMPVILGPDGPSLGGFVCPATVIQADLWKLGQLKAGAKVRFQAVTLEQAVALESAQDESIALLSELPDPVAGSKSLVSPIIKTSVFGDDEVVYRLAGDHFLLVEMGPLELDIERRFKVHALMLWLGDNLLPGMREMTPGIRSLQVHYDSQQLSVAMLMALIEKGCRQLADKQQLSVPARVVHLPLSWDDDACRLAIEKYVQSVRPDAPWCPSNLEFIRRINGLPDIEAVKDIVFDASYLVMGLGDVYLGAPVATPLDPRHRLVTTKYNPARTWTAENSVGIGGAYMCVYGMEGPGGYQFVGRTLQMWNRYRHTECFEQPWLLRFFDQIRFYPVSPEELQQIRRDFPLGNYPLKIEEIEFDLVDYQQFLDREADSINQFQHLREGAFAEELEHWRAEGLLTYEQQEAEVPDLQIEQLPEGVTAITSAVAGNVWQLQVAEGDSVRAGDVLMVLESMKMEIDIHAECDGRVEKIYSQKSQGVVAGQTLLWLSNS